MSSAASVEEGCERAVPSGWVALCARLTVSLVILLIHAPCACRL